jgi:hypothetical protein
MDYMEVEYIQEIRKNSEFGHLDIFKPEQGQGERFSFSNLLQRELALRIHHSD